MSGCNDQAQTTAERLTATAEQGATPAPGVSADDKAAASQPARTPTGGPVPAPKEVGGPKGPEPTRFGDWERNGRCIDF